MSNAEKPQSRTALLFDFSENFPVFCILCPEYIYIYTNKWVLKFQKGNYRMYTHVHVYILLHFVVSRSLESNFAISTVSLYFSLGLERMQAKNNHSIGDNQVHRTEERNTIDEPIESV